MSQRPRSNAGSLQANLALGGSLRSSGGPFRLPTNGTTGPILGTAPPGNLPPRTTGSARSAAKKSATAKTVAKKVAARKATRTAAKTTRKATRMSTRNAFGRS